MYLLQRMIPVGRSVQSSSGIKQFSLIRVSIDYNTRGLETCKLVQTMNYWEIMYILTEVFDVFVVYMKIIDDCFDKHQIPDERF